MNENIDLTKILKNCPEGWEFYSSVLGDVEFEGIFDDRKQADCIVVRTGKLGYTTGFTKEGFYLKGKGECTLFPSKDQREWSKFTAPWYKKEPEQNMEAIQIHQEVTALLEAFGYKPRVKVNKPTVGYIDICFPVKYGSETMPNRHKDAISILAKGYLSEFYYASGNQHVYLRNECNGLKPNDDRYSCLIHEMRLVSSNEPCFCNGQEVFVNMGDHFKRFVNWKEVTSE